MAQQAQVQYIRYYTAGSAARELAPEIRQQPKAAPRPRKAKRAVLYIDPVAILGIATAVFMLVCMLVGLVQLNETYRQRDELSGQVQQLIEKNESLRTQYNEGYDLEQIEKTALALGMVPAEQVAHVSIDTGR